MLNGCRVLLVEDEPLISELVKDLLLESDAHVVGPALTVGAARQIVRDGTAIDVAVLDLNLGDGTVTPVLEALAGRGIPMIIYTGGTLPDAVRQRHPNLRVLTKPVSAARLLGELRSIRPTASAVSGRLRSRQAKPAAC